MIKKKWTDFTFYSRRWNKK